MVTRGENYACAQPSLTQKKIRRAEIEPERRLSFAVKAEARPKALDRPRSRFEEPALMGNKWEGRPPQSDGLERPRSDVRPGDR